MGYTFGGKIGLNFNLNYQITLDFMHRNADQRYYFQPREDVQEWVKTVNYRSFDLPLLFRHNSDNGSFLEIGPQFSFINGATETDKAGVETDISNQFTETNFGAVIGFGSFMLGANNTYLVFGLRIHYGFLDLITYEGGRGFDTYLPVRNGELDEYEPGFTFDGYKPTTPLSALAYLEINYDLAYLVRSECKRTALRFF